ncbi:ATP-binding protein, partial [Candidatus Poribacteria bacterium]|nr:ATP-binding protein [Candidatus Poribacteria bacterium]
KEVLDQIYEPFFTTKTHGSGLGLPVVRQLIEGMGGTTHIESEPERGTTVHLLLRTPRYHSGEEGGSQDSVDLRQSLVSAAAAAEAVPASPAAS